MLLVHKIELNPNNIQATYFAKACGIARFAYNWALAEWQKQYANGAKPTEAGLRKSLNQIKKELFPWMLEVTKVAPQQAIKNLGSAFNRFFKQQGKYPRFKKKGIHDAFRADNGPTQKNADAVSIDGKKIKLPCIGWVKMRERLRFSGQIKSVTISKKAGRWYAAISIECQKLLHKRKNQGSVGVDLGIKTLATLSNGIRYEGPKAHTVLLRCLRRLSQRLSKKKPGGKNFGKAKNKLAKLHTRITNIRLDSLHKLTTDLILNYTKIGIEDLNIKGMVKNRKLSRHIMDQAFYEFRRQLAYKAHWYGSELVVVDRFYPSSKICNVCGYKNDQLTLSDREWTCTCNEVHDRDLNAAINIKKFANTESSSGIYACGEESSGVSAVWNTKLCFAETRIQH
jgi:putative transposase